MANYIDSRLGCPRHSDILTTLSRALHEIGMARYIGSVKSYIWAVCSAACILGHSNNTDNLPMRLTKLDTVLILVVSVQ